MTLERLLKMKKTWHRVTLVHNDSCNGKLGLFVMELECMRPIVCEDWRPLVVGAGKTIAEAEKALRQNISEYVNEYGKWW